MAQFLVSTAMIPHRMIMLPAALTDDDRAWCRAQLVDTDRTLFDDYRNPYGDGPDVRWITTEELR
jgi:hypothetical protein